MTKYLDVISKSYKEYAQYLFNELSSFHLTNYLYWLVGISALVFILEIVVPWRKDQPIIRKDFWLDTFYMFFNFFLFNLIVFIALSNVAEQAFIDVLARWNMSLTSIQLINLNSLHLVVRLLLFFLITDFVQWNIHRLLHRVPFLWNFHKVHHSVKNMGFAAHLRYHWMETVVYKSLLYLPLALIGGFNVQDVMIVHLVALTIGHLNHANINLNYSFLSYIFNNPKMHIWHHAKDIPAKFGVNFGISLSLWDYIFKTNYIPKDGKDIELGFTGDEDFPENFIEQEIYPIKLK